MAKGHVQFILQEFYQSSWLFISNSVVSPSLSRIGPTGSAICVYRTDNSFQTGGTGQNKGIFDIFREDLLQDRDDPLLDLEVQNFWTEVRLSACLSVCLSIYL